MDPCPLILSWVRVYGNPFLVDNHDSSFIDFFQVRTESVTWRFRFPRGGGNFRGNFCMGRDLKSLFFKNIPRKFFKENKFGGTYLLCCFSNQHSLCSQCLQRTHHQLAVMFFRSCKHRLFELFDVSSAFMSVSAVYQKCRPGLHSRDSVRPAVVVWRELRRAVVLLKPMLLHDAHGHHRRYQAKNSCSTNNKRKLPKPFVFLVK